LNVAITGALPITVRRESCGAIGNTAMAGLSPPYNAAMNTQGVLCYCRPGFEPELAAELTERAAAHGLGGYARTERNSGHVIFIGDDGLALTRALPFRELIFARQKLRLLAELRDLDPKDRIAPMLEALRRRGFSPDQEAAETISGLKPLLQTPTSGLKPLLQPLAFGTLVVEHPDSDEAKPLAGLARSFGNALRPALRKAGLLAAQDNGRLLRLHVCFVDGDHAFLAVGDPRDSAPWPQGIPRLKLLPDAPSRSALKLEEALMVLLGDDERERLLRPGMRAADLGAAPGGWTWVLARQNLQVTAVDNGPLRQHVIDTGLVQHLRADGFAWHPAKPLDWMVCDMVEQPSRVAARMAEWFREGWCRHAIFNLKLPMKKRWQETRQCLERFEDAAGRSLIVRAKQLYHDREEITVFATTHTDHRP
jgi:23S rRNA (cytidine2498-2'-O)-methyltransferase